MPTNPETVRAALEAFGRGDVRKVLAMCSEDVRVVFRTTSSTIPFRGTWNGKSRVAEYFRTIDETAEVLKWQAQHEVAAGRHVVAFVVNDIRVKATGKTTGESTVVLDIVVDEGEITRWDVYGDTAALEHAYTATAAASV